MRWLFWRRDKDRLIRARRERDEVRRKGQAREPMLRRLDAEHRIDAFGERFREALGGE